jgi:hypothetical protein
MIQGWRLIAILLVAAATLAPVRSSTAGGLNCSVGEVVVENLKIGHRYSLKTLANLPLSVTNTGDQALRVSVDPLVPGPSELRLGAEAIPDVGWASSSPETLDLGPHEMRAADLGLNIPDDGSLLGRKFEVIFWSHSLPQPGELIAYGLKSRVIFTVDRERDTTAIVPSGELSLSLSPGELKLKALVPGRAYRLEDLTQPPLTLRNTSSRPLNVELKVESAEMAGGATTNGCADLTRSGVVSLSEPRFTLAPGEERTVTGTISLAKTKGIRGKNLMCVIVAAVTDLPVRTQICSRVYAHAE